MIAQESLQEADTRRNGIFRFYYVQRLQYLQSNYAVCRSPIAYLLHAGLQVG
jgi:hypothetical protein